MGKTRAWSCRPDRPRSTSVDRGRGLILARWSRLRDWPSQAAPSPTAPPMSARPALSSASTAWPCGHVARRPARARVRRAAPESGDGWWIKKFVRTTRRYRTIHIQAGDHTLTAADPLPDDLRQALARIHSHAEDGALI